jgi:hypothetical protein
LEALASSITDALPSRTSAHTRGAGGSRGADGAADSTITKVSLQLFTRPTAIALPCWAFAAPKVAKLASAADGATGSAVAGVSLAIPAGPAAVYQSHIAHFDCIRGHRRTLDQRCIDGSNRAFVVYQREAAKVYGAGGVTWGAARCVCRAIIPCNGSNGSASYNGGARDLIGSDG